ncbi:MAG: hypothetical protein WC091_20125 [Sulfuricellaceae bacterium]
MTCALEAGLPVLEVGGNFADGVIAFEGNWLGGEAFASFGKKAAAPNILCAATICAFIHRLAGAASALQIACVVMPHKQFAQQSHPARRG